MAHIQQDVIPPAPTQRIKHEKFLMAVLRKILTSTGFRLLKLSP